MNQKGFTLIEVMLAVVILAIAGIMLVRTQGDSIRLCEESGLRMRGVFLGQQIMTEIESTADLVPGTIDGNFEEPDTGFHYQKFIEETGIPGLRHIVVTVFYEDREMITIHAYISNAKIFK